jgi:hypothetical protein
MPEETLYNALVDSADFSDTYSFGIPAELSNDGEIGNGRLVRVAADTKVIGKGVDDTSKGAATKTTDLLLGEWKALEHGALLLVFVSPGTMPDRSKKESPQGNM